MDIIVEVDPATAHLVQKERPSASDAFKTQRFLAYVHNDPGNKGVTWEVSQGAGDIDSRGVFTPPVMYNGVTGQSTVTARSVTDQSKTASAIITYK